MYGVYSNFNASRFMVYGYFVTLTNIVQVKILSPHKYRCFGISHFSPRNAGIRFINGVYNNLYGDSIQVNNFTHLIHRRYACQVHALIENTHTNKGDVNSQKKGRR